MSFVPAGTGSVGLGNPPLKRWAMVGRRRGTSAEHHLGENGRERAVFLTLDPTLDLTLVLFSSSPGPKARNSSARGRASPRAPPRVARQNTSAALSGRHASGPGSRGTVARQPRALRLGCSIDRVLEHKSSRGVYVECGRNARPHPSPLPLGRGRAFGCVVAVREHRVGAQPGGRMTTGRRRVRPWVWAVSPSPNGAGGRSGGSERPVA